MSETKGPYTGRDSGRGALPARVTPDGDVALTAAEWDRFVRLGVQALNREWAEREKMRWRADSVLPTLAFGEGLSANFGGPEKPVEREKLCAEFIAWRNAKLEGGNG